MRCSSEVQATTNFATISTDNDVQGACGRNGNFPKAMAMRHQYEAQEKIEVIMEQLNHYLGKKLDQKNVVECALYFEEYLRRVIEERNGVSDYEVTRTKISMSDGEELNIMTENTELKLILEELKREHTAVCNQRDELNDLLGKMMYKNVRLKKREVILRGMNKKLKKKLREKTKLIQKRRKTSYH